MIDNSVDRKFNIVIYGVKESPKGTQRSARTKSDTRSQMMTLVFSQLETVCVWGSTTHPNLDQDPQLLVK